MFSKPQDGHLYFSEEKPQEKSAIEIQTLGNEVVAKDVWEKIASFCSGKPCYSPLHYWNTEIETVRTQQLVVGEDGFLVFTAEWTPYAITLKQAVIAADAGDWEKALFHLGVHKGFSVKKPGH